MTSLFNPMDPSLYDNSYLFAQAIPTPLEGARVKASLDNVAISMQSLSLSVHSSTEGLRSSFGEDIEKLSGVLGEIKSVLDGKSVDSSIVPSIKKLVKATTGIESNCKNIDAAVSTLVANLNRSMEEIKSGLRVQAVREQLMAKKIDQLESKLEQRENNSEGAGLLRALEEMEGRLLSRIDEMRGGSAGSGREIGIRDGDPTSTPATTPPQIYQSNRLKLYPSFTASNLSPSSRPSSTIGRDSVRTISTSDNDSNGQNGLSRTTSKKRKIEQSQSEAEPDTEDDEPILTKSPSVELVEPDTEDDERVDEKKAPTKSDGGEVDLNYDPTL